MRKHELYAVTGIFIRGLNCPQIESEICLDDHPGEWMGLVPLFLTLGQKDFHLSDGTFKSDKHGMRNNTMADVEFLNIGNAGQPFGIPVIQPVSRAYAQS